jgi:hypothetical protein
MCRVILPRDESATQDEVLYSSRHGLLVYSVLVLRKLRPHYLGRPLMSHGNAIYKYPEDLGGTG